MQMNLMYIVPSLGNVGPTNVVLSLVKKLSQNGIDISIFSFRDGEMKDEFSHYSKVIITRNIFTIIKAARKEETVVHSHGFFPDFINAILNTLLLNKNNFSTIHNFIKLDYKLLKGDILGTIYTSIHKLFLKKINFTVNCSKSAMVYNNISKYYIYNGVDDYYSPLNHHSKEIEKKIRLVCLGVLSKRKNIEVILSAFASKDRDNMELYVIGNGENYKNFKEKYNQKNIFFTGKINYPFNIINDCDFIISSSLAEGFPLAVLESLSCRLSYILSKIPPHEEIFSLTHENGFLCENTTDSYIKVIDSLEKIDYEHLKNNCRNYYLSNFTTEIMAAKYLDLYKQALYGTNS
ncbi:UDP-D-galactose:(glucosyl)lipopolysaccharide-1,6-D-galactosyltransferase [Providencia alcalifaciens]|nr:UDP-D-galactose:(glucosyl)lipopolysaccharide-1,6-D-galactosyltransferase [Providencia alcalifaciens]